MTQESPGSDQTRGGQAELRELLTRAPHFASLDGETLAALVDACEVIDVAGGTCIADAGRPFDALLGVLHGGLRIVRYGKDGTQRTIRELYRGDMLGVMGLFSDRPFPVALFAVRDSTLLRLSRDRFLTLAQWQPQLLLSLARLMSERAFDVLDAFASNTRQPQSARGGNLAILPLSLDPSVLAAKDLLIGLALGEQRAIHVNAPLVDAALGHGAADSDGDDGARVTAWLSNLERATDVVLYECDPRLPAWTARCKRQSDRLVILAAAGDSPAHMIGQATAHARTDDLPRPADLVLVHPPEARVPSATRLWATLPDVRAIHHVHARDRRDLARVARRLVGKPTGLVLSGGGARGIAHVGVIAAIAEAGIPIDYVCGTSMGAIFGAGLAMGFDSDRLRAELRQLFGKPFALYDLTLPISSLLAGKKLDRVLQRQFGAADIEDLWLPFFCVSTDLARAKLVVHERGPLWKSVRASCSIPGIFPPVPLDGRTLVDGGLVDNLPLDLLVERCSGPIIAVDVFPYGDPGFTQPSGRIARLLRQLRSRVRGEPASPPLFDILVRSTLVGSKFRQQVAISNAEDLVYLEPPVAEFGALQWRSHRALFEAGYDYARHELGRQRARFPPG